MPYIKLSVTQKLSQDKQEELVNAIGEALSLIPGKQASFLITDMEDGKTMYLGGEKQEDMVFADVRYYGNYEFQVKSDFTVAFFDAVNKVLGTRKDRMWLTITEFNSWGGFGDFVEDNALSQS